MQKIETELYEEFWTEPKPSYEEFRNRTRTMKNFGTETELRSDMKILETETEIPVNRSTGISVSLSKFYLIL